MPVEHGSQSNYAKEMRLHEAHPSQFGPPGRPYVFREFPKRMYKAERTDKGIVITEAFNANDADEERNFQSRGFHFGQDAAFAAVHAEHTEHGKLAAEREAAIQKGKLSERAVEEVRAAEAEHGARHLPDVPEKAVRRRGPNKPKAVTA
jgi:hypothetical protein